MFSKHISGEETSSKVPTNTPRVFHAEKMRTRRFHVVSTLLQQGTHAVYRAKTIIKRHTKESFLQRVFQKLQLQKQ